MAKKIKPFQIAIDGPVSAGKSTIAELIAHKLNLIYINTGSTYRIATLLALDNDIKIDQENKIVELIKKSNISLQITPQKDGSQKVAILLNDKDITNKLNQPRINKNVALVAKLPKVRKILVKKQQLLAQSHNVVMEGRDITYRVLPNANLKIFLTASVQVRAKRQAEKLNKSGVEYDFEQIKQDLKQRDYIDTHRETDPLKKVKDAWEIDTSNLNIDQVVQLISNKAKKLMNKRHV